MFSKLTFNLKDRECITISSDSEADEEAILSDNSLSSLSPSTNEAVIDEIVYNYTKSKPNKQTWHSSKYCYKKEQSKQYGVEEKPCNKPDIQYSVIKTKTKRKSSEISLQVDNHRINNILKDLLDAPNKHKLQQNKRSKQQECENEEDLLNKFSLKYQVKVKNFEKVFNGETKLKDICLSCGSIGNIACPHPLFEGGLCQKHMEMFQEWFFKYDQDGCSSYCSICCMGENVVICDQTDCGRCYCSNCLDLLVGPGEYDFRSAETVWFCYFCDNQKPLHKYIIKRPDWRCRLQDLFTTFDESAKYPPLSVPVPVALHKRQPIRVLSLFDGIATGLLAIKQLGLKVEKFIASEIDESAIRLVQNRHPDVIHVGDITELKTADIEKLGPFDLVIGGSPCNDLSGANPRRKGLLDAEGTGCLFFDFYRVLVTARPSASCHNSGETSRPFFWLFENVLSMKKVERERISRFFECDPIVADARVVSAAARPRLFWGNLPHMKQLNLTASPGDKLSVQSCLEKDRIATVEKLNTITTKPGCLYQGGERVAPVRHMGKDDVLWTTEIERIFGVPEHYTDVNNLGPKERLALLGRSWSVPVMRQLLAPLKEYFTSSKL